MRERFAGLDPVALLNEIRTVQQELLSLLNHAPSVTVSPGTTGVLRGIRDCLAQRLPRGQPAAEEVGYQTLVAEPS